MEDKTFQLLEKMYSEFIQFKKDTYKRFDSMDSKINGMDNKVNSMDNKIYAMDNKINSMDNKIKHISKTVINIEQDHGQKLNALFDGYKQNAEGISEINEKIDKLTDRVENQEIKLQVLKSVK